MCAFSRKFYGSLASLFLDYEDLQGELHKIQCPAVVQHSQETARCKRSFVLHYSCLGFSFPGTKCITPLHDILPRGQDGCRESALPLTNPEN